MTYLSIYCRFASNSVFVISDWPCNPAALSDSTWCIRCLCGSSVPMRNFWHKTDDSYYVGPTSRITTDESHCSCFWWWRWGTFFARSHIISIYSRYKGCLKFNHTWECVEVLCDGQKQPVHCPWHWWGPNRLGDMWDMSEPLSLCLCRVQSKQVFMLQANQTLWHVSK